MGQYDANQKIANIDVSATPQEAWALMQQLNVHHLVVTYHNRIVGVVSDQDLGGVSGEAFRIMHALSELMRAYPPCLNDSWERKSHVYVHYKLDDVMIFENYPGGKSA